MNELSKPLAEELRERNEFLWVCKKTSLKGSMVFFPLGVEG
jgi:hypothetical protein